MGWIAAAACDTLGAMPPHSEPEDGAASTLLHPHAHAATITVREREGGTQMARRGAAARGEEAVDRIDRYVILRELGRGGMGVVYAAYDTVLDRKVALKLLRDRVGGVEGHERMLREARALARLSHPNVVGIYEVGEVGQRVFLTMEMVDGISLRAWLRAQPRGQAEILAAFLQAAEGLAAAHAAGLVHRDFKPDNVLVGDDGRVRVMDFGLARLETEAAEAASPSRAAVDPLLTAAGALLGTPAYMAPEQHMGLVAYAVADIFSFAVALYEALHGERPFQGTSAAELSERVLGGRRTHAPTPGRVPAWLQAVVLRGMAVEPIDRWPTMRAFAAALRADPRVQIRRLLAATVAIAGALGLAFGLPVAWHALQVRREHERVSALAEARLQVVEALPRHTDASEADAAFTAFLAAEEHRGTRALSRAWLRRGQAAWSAGQVDAALDAMARAYVEANEPVDIVAAMRAIAEVHHARWQPVELAAVLAVLAEHGGDGDPAVLRMRVDAALEHNDVGAALTAVTAPAAPPELAGLRPLLAPLTRMRSLGLRGEQVVPVRSAAGPGFVVLSGVGTRLTLTDAALRPRATLDVPGGVQELVAGRPAYFSAVAGASTLFTWEGGAPTPVWTDPTPEPMFWPRIAAWVELAGGGAFYFGGQWTRRGFYRLGETDGAWQRTPAHAETHAGSSDLGALLAEDLDGDGRRELVLGTGVWNLLDVRVFRDGDGGLELVDTRAPGRITGLAALRDADTTRLAVLKDDRYAPFSAPPHTGEEAGVYLYELRAGRLIDVGHLPLPRRGELAALPIAERLLDCDLDGDGRRDLVAGLTGNTGASAREREPHAAVFRQRPGGGFDRVVLGVHPLACAQLDDDVADELVVRGLGPDAQAVWALGVGDTPVPPRVDAAPPAPAPPFVDPLLTDRWTRAGQLVASGLTQAAVRVLGDTAKLTANAGDEQRFLVRAAGLLQDHGQTRAAADLYERAARRVALPGAVALRAADAHLGVGEVAAADRLLRSSLEEPGQDASTRVAARARLSVLAPLLDRTVTVSLAAPLAPAWQLNPLALHHDLRARILHLATDGYGEELASLPLAWSGDAVAMTIDLSVVHLEIGAEIEFALVDAEGRTIISVGLVRPTGFQQQQTLTCHDPSQPTRAVFGEVPTTTRTRRRIHARVLWDPVRRRVVCDAEVDEHAAHFASRPLALPARPGPARLVIRAAPRAVSLVVGELHGLTLHGALPPPVPTPRPGPRQRAAHLLVAGRPAEALQQLAADELPLWRFLALDRLREPVGAAAALRRYLADTPPVSPGDTDPLRRLLRAQPDRVGAPLRAIVGADIYPHVASVMYSAFRYHPDEAWVHELLLTEFPWRDGLDAVDPDTRLSLLLMHAVALAANDRHAEASVVTWSAVAAARDPSLSPELPRLTAAWLVLAAKLAAEAPDAAIAAVQEAILSSPSPATTRNQARTLAEFDALGADPAWLATVGPGVGR